MPTGGLWSCFDYRWGGSRGRRGGIGVVRGHHSGENWSDRGCGRWLSRRSLGWDRGRRCGAMRNEEGAAVDSRCGVLRIAWFGITWCDGGMGSAWWYRVRNGSMRVVG